MILFKVECKKTLIMEVHNRNIWEDENQTLIDVDQLDISFYKNKKYLFIGYKNGKYFTIDENNDLHCFDYKDIIKYFNVIKEESIYDN